MDLLSKVQKQIDELENVKEFVARIPNLNDIYAQITVDKNGVYIRIPFDWKAYRELRKRFRGWVAMDEWTITNHDDLSVSQHKSIWPNDGRRMYFQGPRVSIALDTALDNSVCHLEQVGIKEVPQYKVVCK